MMIHMNMQLTPSVLRSVASITRRVSRPRSQAARVAVAAPTAELSTRLVTPSRKRPVIDAKIRKGRMPARSRRSFAARLTRRSARGSTGPRCGCNWQRTAI